MKSMLMVFLPSTEWLYSLTFYFHTDHFLCFENALNIFYDFENGRLEKNLGPTSICVFNDLLQ